MNSVRTICSYCGVGCGVVAKSGAGGITVSGDEEHPVNRGALCSKGLNLHHTVNDTSDRILYPMMRSSRQSPPRRVSWDAAIDRAAAVFRSIQSRHGRDSIAFYVSGQLLTEEYYLANKLVKGLLGTANIDTNSRLCMSTAVVAHKQMLGEDSVPISYNDIDLADLFLVAGANPAWCHPILFRRIQARKQAHPSARLILVDPRRTDTAAFADLHLQIVPGTDTILYHAIARQIIDGGRQNTDFIEKHTNNFADYRGQVMNRTVQEAAVLCGVPAADIVRAAEWIQSAQGFLNLWAMGLNQSSQGVEKTTALIALNLLTGQIGRPGAGPFSLTGQPNAMGGREVGGLSNMLAAHRDLENPQHRQEVAAAWNVPVDSLPARPGLTATEIFEALEKDKLKAVWIVCTNPTVSLPNAQLVDRALEKARFVVVQDISWRSDSTRYADLVLPAAGWLEKSGTMTNSERRIAFLPKLKEPPGEALPDSEIFQRFAGALGFAEFARQTPAEIYDEHAQLTRSTNLDISGLSHRRLQEEGSIQWPVPDKSHKGTERLFSDGQFFTADGRARFITAAATNPSEQLSPDYPLILTTGRVRDQWHTMTRTGKVSRLGQHAPEPFVEIHPEDAQAYGIAEQQLVEVRSQRGHFRGRARLTDAIRRGVLFAPMHWGRVQGNAGPRTNNATSDQVDPTSKEPDFKFAAVQLCAALPEPRKVLVIGAGAAALSFLNESASAGSRDEFTVLCAEEHAFYNRIFLPDYISGTRVFSDISQAEQVLGRVAVVTDARVTRIDRQAKSVHTTKGVFGYDLLILAVGGGARPHRRLERMLPAGRLFSLRDKSDADSIIANAGKRLLVVGGGLLGVELTDALGRAGRKVTLVHRSAHLMGKQLDQPTADYLAAELRERGHELYLNSEVVACNPFEGGLAVYLSGGQRIYCDSVVTALGTQPRTSLARDAGLAVNYGILTDARLTTSDESIFAIGECIEYEGQTFGTTLAAQQQAEILARSLMGDPSATYNGSASVNVLKIHGLQLAALGRAVPTEADEVLLSSDLSAGRYKKILLRHDRVVGAVLLGDNSSLGELRDLFSSGLELGEKRASLLGATATKSEANGRLICSCRSVGEADITNAMEHGCQSVEAIGKHTGAGSGCGSCLGELALLLRAAQQNQTSEAVA